MNLVKNSLYAGILSGMLSLSAQAAEWMVEITNLSHGVYFTPLLVSAHDDSMHLYQPGHAASSALRAMAEGGDISGLVSMLGGEDSDTVSNPAGGMLAPGGTATAMVMPAAGHNHLSFTTMILPSNDAFVGLNSMMVPNMPGTYMFYANAYDAGTEANNEVVAADGGMPGTLGIPPVGLSGMGSGGSGVTTEESNKMVHVHRGILGDTNATGGISDTDSRVHRWLNPVASVMVTVK
jgi:hypothetical protein